jgi:hypothetical protein
MIHNQKMKTRIAAASATASKPVDVVIGVTKFRDVLANETSRGCRDTDYTMQLRRADSRAYIKGDDIHVRRPGAPIRFTVTSSPNDKDHYFPVGITFVREDDRSSSERQRLGFLNFPQRATRAEGRTLTILDTYRDRSSVRYKFSLVLQRGSDGKIGIIDPGIIHETS